MLVRLAVSGVNPTDWKARRQWPLPAGWQTPGEDGAGVVEAVGTGVEQMVGERVWVWEAAWQRPFGTAAEYTVVPVRQAVRLGDASFDLGASLGIPFLTAHRCLTVGETMPDRVHAGTMSERVVLVQGGAGAVGNAAIQLARWADATVIATVSSPEKAQLAAAAGASFVINYREQDVVDEVRKIAPDGVDTLVEVSAAVNAATDVQVLRHGGAVCVYADDGDEVHLDPPDDGAEHPLAVRTDPHRDPRALASADAAQRGRYGLNSHCCHYSLGHRGGHRAVEARRSARSDQHQQA
jgi:NADPH2:quinone reductase